MKAKVVDGELILTYRMKDEADVAAARTIHGRQALWECWLSWDKAPDTAKMTFKPVYSRLKENK